MVLSRRGLLGGLPVVLARASRAEAAPVQIYATMTVRPALDRVLAAYRAAGGAAVAVYALTPVLVRQLAGGAAADILLSADSADGGPEPVPGLVPGSRHGDKATAVCLNLSAARHRADPLSIWIRKRKRLWPTRQPGCRIPDITARHVAYPSCPAGRTTG